MAEKTPLAKKVDIGELERKVFDFFTLSQLGKSLISIQDMENLARVFASCVYEASSASNVALLIYDFRKKAFVYHYSIGLEPDKVKNISFVEEEGLFWQVLNGGVPFPIRDSLGNYRFEAILKKWGLDRLDSHIWFPLMVKNVLRGVLTMGEKRTGALYADSDMTFVSQLANQAALAIDSAILNQQKAQATEALGKKMQDLSVLYDVSKALNFANDLKKTLLLILDKSRNAVHAQKGSIMLLNKDTMELEVKVVRGIDPMFEKKINDGDIECTRIKVGEGVAGKVAETLKPIVVDDVKLFSEFKKSDTSNVENIACLPLVAGDECVGVMNITNKLSGERFTNEDVEFLTTLAGQVAITINNAKLYHLAITDGLTGLFISRYFHQKLHDEVLRAKRYQRPLSLLMMDIDHFKKFNDTYGHQQGDVVLATTARLLKKISRETDIPCRYGGEEFAMILTETGSEGAGETAERLRESVQEYEYPSLSGKPLRVTVSLGIGTYPVHALDEESLIEKADKALYASKEAGRNRVTVYWESLNQADVPVKTND